MGDESRRQILSNHVFGERGKLEYSQLTSSPQSNPVPHNSYLTISCQHHLSYLKDLQTGEESELSFYFTWKDTPFQAHSVLREPVQFIHSSGHGNVQQNRHRIKLANPLLDDLSTIKGISCLNSLETMSQG